MSFKLLPRSPSLCSVPFKVAELAASPKSPGDPLSACLALRLRWNRLHLAIQCIGIAFRFREQRQLPQKKNLSKFNYTACSTCCLRFVPLVTQWNARLASGCWSACPGRYSNLLGLSRRFQILHFILLRRISWRTPDIFLVKTYAKLYDKSKFPNIATLRLLAICKGREPRFDGWCCQAGFVK